MRLQFGFANFVGLLATGELVNATRLTLQGRRRSQFHAEGGFQRRGSILGTSALNNSADISYYTNLTLGRSQYTVLIDTGSSDLWVAGSVPGSNDTGKTTGVSYAVGAVEGPIKTALLDFAGYTVPSQAYLEVTPDNTNPEGLGLIGLGPNSGSTIYQTLNNDVGLTVLDRIFTQNTTTPNFITVLLGRSDDPTNAFPGDLTVGEVLPGYEDVSQQPQLIVTDVPIFDTGDQHFQILLDADGIIGPDGQAIPITTEVNGTSNRKQATAVLDTGFTLPQVPKSVADAMYSKFANAEFKNVSGVGPTWVLPCEQEVNITFKFGGKAYPIHPLDATLEPSTVGLGEVKSSKGVASCIGTFQPVSFDSGPNVTYDLILGMAFLRNVYMLVNYGDFVEGSTNKSDPFVQLLSTSNDTSENHSEFVKVRLTDSSLDDIPLFNSKHRKTLTWIIIVAALGVAGLLLLCAAYLCRRRRNRLRRGVIVGATYHPLNNPVQPDMYPMAGPQPYDPRQPYSAQQPYYVQQPYNPNVSQTRYETSWDRRY